MPSSDRGQEPDARHVPEDSEEGDGEGGDGSSGEGDDVGSLISFANLENVVKHIIRKFKSLETFNENTETEIRVVRNDVSSRATNDAMAELQAELASRVDAFNKTFSLQKDSINAMEVQLERSRQMYNSIEKKLEATVKEKVVQDRLIRETQDALQDKVAVAELNMFEAKFAGYTTKLEHQDVTCQLNDYARLDVAERLAENLKSLVTRFDDYTRTAKIEQQMQELRDWTSGELQQYAKQRSTLDRIEELQANIRDQAVSFERSQSMSEDKVRGLSDRVTSIYTELNSDLQQRALAEDLNFLKDSLKKYALKADVDAFQQDCAPKLHFCVDSLKAFDDRLSAQDDAIQRMDEVLLDKAAKYDIVVMNAKLDQCFGREEGTKEFAAIKEAAAAVASELTAYIEAESERLKAFRPPDITPMIEEMHSRITLKADKADLVELYQLKANRIDADELAKLQDTIHRQLEYLSVTTFGLSKLCLTEARPGESKTLRTQQKSQVLMQSEALWSWILHNEPPPNLDTLRPPPGQKKAAGGDKPASAGGEGDKEKRTLDDVQRAMLEKKLGIGGS